MLEKLLGDRKSLIKEFLNDPAEVHSFVHGLYAGVTEWKGAQLPDNPDVKKEPHYFKGGYLLGTFIRWVAIVILGSKIIS
jgi:hypothetical protein